MYIRCATCHGSFWAEEAHAAEGELRADCNRCGREFRIPLTEERWAEADGLEASARKCAEIEGIDLPGAYSVLFDLMTVEEVRELGHTDSAVCHTSRTGNPQGRVGRFDPAFGPAVAAGTLTPRQAFERGKRATFIEKLVRRHKISDELAAAVADNRTSLLEALRRREETPALKLRIQADAAAQSSSRTAVLAVVALVLGAGYGLYERHGPRQERALEPALLPSAVPAVHGGSPASRSPTTSTADILRQAAEVRLNDRGEVTRVVGPDPRSVLIAFCESGGEYRDFEPLDVAPAVPPSARTVLGVVREIGERERFWAIVIRKDLESRRWFAGDGRDRVTIIPAPELAVRSAQTRL